MWSVSETMQAWHLAMAEQDAHDLDCQPCRQSETPACAEGKQLQAAAWDAHGEWISERYAGRAVA